MRTKIILGPPGTGKTTHCLDIVDNHLKAGVKPSQIGFFSFTTKAAEEAKTRACLKFSLELRDLPYFQTLHSLAFRGAALMHSQVITLKHLQEIGSDLGIQVTRYNPWDDGGVTFGMKKGDKMFHLQNLYRMKKTTLREEWLKFDDDEIGWSELEKLQTIYNRYKDSRKMLDFSDMIKSYIEKGSLPHLQLLIIDEAQDLSSLQWDLVNRLKANVPRVVVAGDDDQAIYQWAGADIETFIKLEGEVEVLSQSYRVPLSVHKVAEMILKGIGNRRPKEWKPRAEQGLVCFHQGYDEVDMSKGSWLMLARNNYLLEGLEGHCRRMGYAYESKSKSPLQEKSFEAIKYYQRVIHGRGVTSAQACRIYDYMTADVGYKRGCRAFLGKQDPKKDWDLNTLKREAGLLMTGHWTDALDKVNFEDRSYFQAALNRGEDLHKAPRIKVSTIHGVKGGEADHVLIMPDMTAKTYDESLKYPDSENRVWYVGVTRAKQSLHILQPQSYLSFGVLT